MVKTVQIPGRGLNPGMFRAYDVRGFVRNTFVKRKLIYPKDLYPETAYHIGSALGTRLKPGQKVLISGDHRDSTTRLMVYLAKGYRETGIHVDISFEAVPTAGNNWYLITRNYDGAVQIAGSHNPPEFNGLKISEGLTALHGNKLQELIPMIEAELANPGSAYRTVSKEQMGQLSEVDINSPYYKALDRAFSEFRHPWRIILDAHNGMGDGLASLFEAKGAEVEGRYLERDGEFPNGPADPSRPASVEETLGLVTERNKSLKSGEIPWIACFIDGDADRSGFGDEKGQVVDPEKMASIFYRDYLLHPSHAGHFMAMDVRASTSAEQIVRQNGGKGVFIQAGYPSHRQFASAIIPTIGKKGTTFRSSEASGHHFNPTAATDENGKSIPWGTDLLVDDGLYSALLFMQLLDQADQTPEIAKLQPSRKSKRFSLSEFMATIPSAPTSPEIRTPCPDSVKFEIIKRIIKQFQTNPEGLRQPLGEVIHHEGLRLQETTNGLILVDGVRAQYEEGSFGLVRASNTSPNLTYRFEALTEKGLLFRMKQFRDLLAPYTSEGLELDPFDNAIGAQAQKLEK